MNKLEYLLNSKDESIEIYYTWKTLGGLEVDNGTKMYLKDSLFRITEKNSPLYGGYVFCISEYSVNTAKGFNPIDWTDPNLTTDALEGRCYFYQGVESPNFRVILDKEEAEEMRRKYNPIIPDPDGPGSSDLDSGGSDLNSDGSSSGFDSSNSDINSSGANSDFNSSNSDFNSSNSDFNSGINSDFSSSSSDFNSDLNSDFSSSNSDFSSDANSDFSSDIGSDFSTPEMVPIQIDMAQYSLSAGFNTLPSDQVIPQWEGEFIEDSWLVPEDFMPFAKLDSVDPATSSGLIMPDEEYTRIMAELGVPFLSPDELEYNKDTIIKICIKPALDVYYSYFPLVIDEMVGPKASGRQWKVEYHPFETNKTAIPYKADAYMTLGSGTSTGSAYSTAFSFMRTELMGMGSMGGGFQWGNGLRYRKAVPGYVGLENSDAALMALATRQGYMNYFRREYSRDIIENGKKYVQGYTSIGGCLNIHWLCTDLDYNHIPYWDLPNVRKLCTAYALRNIGTIRSLLKTNENIPFDSERMISRADELEKEVLELWKENTLPFALAMNRGGL